MTDWLEPVTLDGRLVRLEPMSLDHLDGLLEVALEPSIWRWMIGQPMGRDDLARWLQSAIENRSRGSELPFVTVDRASGRPIGSSRYLNIVPEHRRLEIGWTWVAPAFQRAGANREAKLLMVEHAIERLGAMRVEFKTDARNDKSRAALLGVGATFEGIFRKHMLMPDGRIRDSAYYAITDEDWPAVKASLAAAVDARMAAAG